MSPIEWVDFSITVHRHNERFVFRAYDGLPTEAAKPVAEASRTWSEVLQSATPPSPMHGDEPGEDWLANMGTVCAGWLLWGSLEEAFVQRVQHLGDKIEQRLRLRLCFDPQLLAEPHELTPLWWEALCLPAWQRAMEYDQEALRRPPPLPRRIYSPFVGHNACISIVRQVLGVSCTPTPAVAEPLRLLVVHCNSPRQPIERLSDMLHAVLQAMEPLRTEHLVECPPEWVLSEPTPDQVLAAITQVNPHILVTMCHGDWSPWLASTPRDGIFVLSDGQGGEAYLYARQIAQTLQAMPEPQLRAALMPHCRTIAAAPALLAAGVPAVVGMQAEILDHRVTVDLVERLFRSLAEYKSLDECVLDVREQLSARFGEGNPHWCLPTLWLAAADSHLFAPLAKVRRGQYLREVLRTHGQMRLFGQQDDVPLARHYVDAVTQREVERRVPTDAAPRPASRGQPIEDWLQAHERVIREFVPVDVFEALTDPTRPPAEKRYYIAGAPGAGKTTLLQHLATRLSKDALQGQGRLPVFVALHALGEWLLQRLDDPNAALLAFLDKQLAPLPDIQSLLARGDIALCFDGLDEVLDKVRLDGRDIALRERLCQSLTWCAQTLPQCPMVITSRLRTCPASLSGFTTLEMKPFDDDKMRAYAKAYFRHVSVVSDDRDTEASADAQRFMDALNRNAHLKALAGTPLLLSLICYLYRLEGLPLPAGQTQLFDRVTHHLLQEDRHRATRTYPEALKRRVLAAIACEVTLRYNRLTAFPYDHFKNVAVKVLKEGKVEFGEADLGIVLEDIVSNSGLLQQLGDGRYTFLHLSFQEYFAASAIASPEVLRAVSISPETVWTFVDKKAWDPDWQPFILFLAGKLPDPTPLLNLLTDKKQDDFFRHRLALAALCLPELSSAGRQAQSATVDAITTEVSSLWFEHSRTGTQGAIVHLTDTLSALA